MGADGDVSPVELVEVCLDRIDRLDGPLNAIVTVDEYVARLRAAGFNVVAKTNVPEFGSVSFTESDLLGPARNPWNVERTAGGSSGGTAAALVAGLVPAATGSDGGGSCRIETTLFSLAGQLERATDWTSRRPSVAA